MSKKWFSIAAKAAGNITVEAETEEEALALARAGEGEWLEDEGFNIEIVDPPSVVDITEGSTLDQLMEEG